MCGRYTLSMSTEELWEELALSGEPGSDVWSQDPAQALGPRFNIAPSQAVPVVTDKSPHKLTLLEWGLVPFWAKDPKIGYRMINARAEGVADKPAFRSAFEKRRCLIVADGFYEWKTDDTGPKTRAKKKAKPKKTPMYVRFEGGGLMTFAGLWSVWRHPDAREARAGDADAPVDPAHRIVSCTILTTESAQGIRDFHDRMPVILPRDARATWLDRDADPSALAAPLHPFTEAPLEIYEVSSAVNAASNEGEDLIVRVSHEADALLLPKE